MLLVYLTHYNAMNTKYIVILAVIALLAIGGFYFSINRNSAPQIPVEFNNNSTPVIPQNQNSVSVPTSPDVPKTTHAISIQNFAFSPTLITIKKGDSIVWINKDSVAHTATSDTGEFGSLSLSTNENYNRVFNTVGTFKYHCTPHPFMKGTIIVTE